MELLVSTEVENNKVVSTSQAEEIMTKEQLIKSVLNALVSEISLNQSCDCSNCYR